MVRTVYKVGQCIKQVGVGSLLDMYLELFDALGITQSMVRTAYEIGQGY